ncbi:MAG: methyltransferase domain-containing protein [Planctomycetaceae bacterium]|nr:methyltransferase domain-containing protein [Planctomycetaceae bacterium]
MNALDDNGQEELFQGGTRLVTYQDESELLERIDWYLRHGRERERVAAEGRREAVARHTYRHRVESILAEAEKQKRTTVAVSTTSSEKDRSYYDFDRPDVLALIPSEARSVLDIGCGSGRLGELLKRRQPARVVGIELDPGAAQRAAARLDDVRRMNLEEDVADFAAGQFDCVVCADVLEHLRHPERLLEKIREWLAPDGCLVSSIPNIRHHSVLTSLLAGNFTYEPAGLLDETHLRFFTRREIEKLLFRAGFEIQELKSVAGPGDEELINAARQGEVRAGRLSIRGLDPSDAAEFHTYQFLVRATPRRSNVTVR